MIIYIIYRRGVITFKLKQTGLFVVVLSFLLVLTFFAAIALGLIRPAFQRLEKQQIADNMGRIRAGIEKQIEKNKQTNQDWANWDDMAKFAQGKYPEFIQTNLADFGFQEKTIGINLCFIFNSKKQIVFNQLWKNDLGGELPVDSKLKAFTNWEKLFGVGWKQDQTISGLARIDTFPVLLSISPIYYSLGVGKPQGWLIFGQFLDNAMVNDIATSTQVPFTINLIDGLQKSFLPENESNRIERSILKDMQENPIVEIQMPVPQTIHDFQQKLILYLFFSFVILLLFFIFIYAIFIKKTEQGANQKESRSNKSIYVIVLLMILVGDLFSVSLFLYMQKQNETNLQNTFLADCQERVTALQRAENDVVPELQWIRRFFINSTEVTKSEFSQFVKPLLQIKPFRSISWVRYQDESNYPIVYLESFDDAPVQIGTNLYTKDALKNAIDKARNSGLVSCSEPIQIKRDSEMFFESTVFVPVFSGGSPQTIEERKKRLRGFVVGSIRLDSLFELQILQTTAKGLPISIFDVENPNKLNLIYSHIPRLGSNKTDPNSKLQFISSIEIANRQFQIKIVPNIDYLQKQSSTYPWIFMLFGILITLLISIYLYKTLALKAQAEYLVAIKTKELSASKEKYRCTLQSIGDGVIAVDPDGCVTSLNPVAEHLTGWTDQEAKGKSFEDIFHIISASSGEKAENPLIQALKTGKVVYLSNDTTLINRLGVHYQIADSAAPILDGQGILTGAVMVFHDVSDEYDMKRSLVESEERFKAIASNAMDAIILINNQGEIVFWNTATERTFGYSYREILNKNMHDLIAPPEYYEKANKGFAEFQKTGKGPALDKLLEMKAKHKDGSIFPVELTVSAVTIKDKYHAIGIIRDITDRKKAEEAIQSQNILLQELMGKKDELLSIAAHDIRSPLTVIKGYADLLLMYSKDSLTTDQIEMISKIQGSTKFIIQLLNDLLDFSALESGKVKLDKQSADFESYMKNYILNTVIVAHQKDMEIYSEIQKDIPPISFDPMKLQQVLNNLTSNAIKFSHPGSNIYITVKADEKNVIVSVKDCGQGIPENEISQLFKPFQKTSVKSTGGEKSTGLGLVIARNIVRSHGGDISVESSVGKGSTFTFTLPISS